MTQNIHITKCIDSKTPNSMNMSCVESASMLEVAGVHVLEAPKFEKTIEEIGLPQELNMSQDHSEEDS